MHTQCYSQRFMTLSDKLPKSLFNLNNFVFIFFFQSRISVPFADLLKKGKIIHYAPLMMTQKVAPRKHTCVLPKKVAYLVLVSYSMLSNRQRCVLPRCIINGAQCSNALQGGIAFQFICNISADDIVAPHSCWPQY